MLGADSRQNPVFIIYRGTATFTPCSERGPLRHLEHLRQIRAYQVATFVHAVCVAPGAITVELLPPFHHVAFAAVFLDQPVNVIHASAAAFGALDTERRGISLMEP
jgi:hypothetical protein